MALYSLVLQPHRRLSWAGSEPASEVFSSFLYLFLAHVVARLTSGTNNLLSIYKCTAGSLRPAQMMSQTAIQAFICEEIPQDPNLTINDGKIRVLSVWR